MNIPRKPNGELDQVAALNQLAEIQAPPTDLIDQVESIFGVKYDAATNTFMEQPASPARGK